MATWRKMILESDGVNVLSAATANYSMGNNKITSLATPTADGDAATKAYVDAAAAGARDVKDSVRIATTANLNLATTGLTAIDGVTPVAGDRVLVKDQTAGAENGIYAAAAGAWARTTDADVSAEVTSGMFVWINEGTANGDSGWLLTTNDPITLGTTALVFTQVSGLGQITAGAGLTKTGNTLDAIGSTSITVAADAISRAELTGDVTAPANSNTLTIAADAVTNAKLANMAANTVKANATAGSADPADLAVGTNTVVGRVAGDIVAAALATGQIAANAVTFAKFNAATAASRIVGRGSAAGAGDFQEITVQSGIEFSGTALQPTYGTSANTVAVGNDGRFTDARPPSASAGGTAFDLGAYVNPLKGLALFGFTTAGRPTAVANGFYFDTTTDHPYVATAA